MSKTKPARGRDRRRGSKPARRRGAEIVPAADQTDPCPSVTIACRSGRGSHAAVVLVWPGAKDE